MTWWLNALGKSHVDGRFLVGVSLGLGGLAILSFKQLD